jgi:Flp pilus assembly protein TadD
VAALTARLGLGRVRLTMSHIGRARGDLEAVLEAYGQAPEESKAVLAPMAAEATFRLAMIEIRRITWAHPEVAEPRLIKKQLEAKRKALRDAQERIEKVLALWDPGWSAAAALALGRLYRRFADWVMDYPPPKEIPPELHEIYRQALEDAMDSIHERACRAFAQTAAFVSRNREGAAYGRAAREELRALGDRCREEHFPWERMRRRTLVPGASEPEARELLLRARRLLKEAPGDEETLLSAAKALLALGRFAEARHIASWLVSSKRPVPLLARTLWAAGEERLARDVTGMYVMDYPANREARAWHAEMNLRLGDLPGALEGLDMLGRGDPGNATWPLARGVALAGLGRFENARLAFERVLKLDPAFPEARYNLAILLFHADDHDGSRQALLQRQEALQMAGEHLDAWRRQAGGSDAAARELGREIEMERQALAESLEAIRRMKQTEEQQAP